MTLQSSDRDVSDEPLISVASVRKRYVTRGQVVEAVKAVSFTVERGQFVSILGPSGCGKSTLLMMVAGLEPVTEGTIRIGGTLVKRPRRSVGIVFQDPTLLPWKTALENTLFPIRLLKLPVGSYRANATQLLDMVGLDGFHDKKPSQLSGGMRQRVAMCRALISDPDLLLMDEPFSALDAMSRDQMNETLMDLWERYRKTALFVTHSIREAVYLSDRVLVMGGKPSRIIDDVTIPFARPRPREVNETAEFNKLCNHLRRRIEEAYAERAQAPLVVAG
jgi:NitT/TauT family transport system ATP-binding protein